MDNPYVRHIAAWLAGILLRAVLVHVAAAGLAGLQTVLAASWR